MYELDLIEGEEGLLQMESEAVTIPPMLLPTDEYIEYGDVIALVDDPYDCKQL